MRFPLLLRRIEGASMLPGLRPGRLLIATAWYRKLKPGDLIIIKHEGVEKIKRIHELAEDNLFVLGDHPEHSTDSRHFGWIERGQVIAKVLK